MGRPIFVQLSPYLTENHILFKLQEIVIKTVYPLQSYSENKCYYYVQIFELTVRMSNQACSKNSILAQA